MILTLPWRRPRPVPRHAAAVNGTAREQAPPDETFPALPPEAAAALRIPFAPASPALLADLAASLKALPGHDGTDPGPEPATLLRAVPRDGSDGSSKELLSGWPAFEGTRITGGGQRVAGITLGGDTDAWVVLDSGSAEWLDELIAAAQQARDALVRGGTPAAPAGGAR